LNALPKRVAILGGGAAGLGALKALLDLPEAHRRGRVIDLYKARSEIGSIW
jgi:uncharacterized protein with NAD-binding domain and iron-sulfur cluster